jgi:RNA polymerase sigma factor (sigma-70 family)
VRRSRRSLRLLGDEQLATLIAAGEDEALEVACNRHLPALVRYCQGILHVREDAEDAAQNAMLAAVRTLPGRPARMNLRAWLFRVAHNEAISMLRRRRPSEPLEEASAAPSFDVTEAAATRARIQQLVKDLHALPERQRSALLMRELCGLGYDEIGAALGNSEQAAMQTVFEARAALLHFEQGRALNCSGIQRMISDGDRRSLRARRVRAHIRSCDLCRTFELAISHRRRDFALLLPVAATSGGLAGALRLGGFLHRLQGVALRGLTPPSGVRGAALTALVAAGGGVSAVQLAHHAHGPGRVAPPAHVAHVVVPHPSAPKGHGGTRPSGIIRPHAHGRLTPTRYVGLGVSAKSSSGGAHASLPASGPAGGASSGSPGSQIASSPLSTPTPPPAASRATTPLSAPVPVAPAVSAGSGSVRVGIGPVRAQVTPEYPGVGPAVSATVPAVSAPPAVAVPVPPAVDVPVPGAGAPATGSVSVTLPAP